MRLDTASRLSLHAALVAATACLILATESLLPELMYLAAPVALIFLVSFLLGNRGALPLWANNVLSLLLVAGWAGWVAADFILQGHDWVEDSTWPAVLLPFAGPLVMLLLLLKLFGPRRLRDFWWLQGLALMEVSLACSLALAPLFALCLVTYVICALWSLYTYTQARSATAGVRAGAPARAEGAVVAPELPPGAVLGKGAGIWVALTRTLVVLLVGGTFFLLTPRVSQSDWHISPVLRGAEPIQTGFSPKISLKNSGPAEVSSRSVVEIYVEDSQGKPKSDMSSEQRFRGVVMHNYDAGQWAPQRVVSTPQLASAQAHPIATEHVLQPGPGEYCLTFQVDLDATQGLFLAEPVLPVDRAGQRAVATAEKTTWAPIFQERDGFLYPPNRGRPAKFSYRQITRSLESNEILPALGTNSSYIGHLLQQPVPGIRRWTRQLLQHLVEKGVLTAGDMVAEINPQTEEPVVLAAERRAKVAHALNDFFATSGQYSYTLDTRRSNLQLDPTEDFLLNVKQGPCQHYATALALMLRSAGIPARLVNGFRGLEPKKDKDGWYVIRESMAHAWVEALVQTADAQGRPQRAWLPLDPSPGDEVRTYGTKSFSWEQWWEYQKSLARGYWHTFFIESDNNPVYGPESPLVDNPLVHGSVDTVNQWRDNGVGLDVMVVVSIPAFLLLAITVAATVLWRWRPWQRTGARIKAPTRIVVPFYARYLALLGERCGLAPCRTQTPREFAETAHHSLLGRGFPQRIAGLPGAIVEYFYRARYGGRSLSAVESGEVSLHLQELTRALAPPSAG